MPANVQRKTAITCGDPAGVGPELIEDWAARNARLARERIVVIGPRHWLDRPSFEGIAREEVGNVAFRCDPGEPSLEGAAVALEAMERAAAGCREGLFGSVVTGPVNKTWLHNAGFSFPGQTEFFANRWGGEPVMGFCGGPLRVALATWHIPLREVPDALNREAITRAVEKAVALGRLDGMGEPRVAVCGLNPHAGENGLLGREERDWIDSLLAELSKRSPVVPHTIPGDTAFHRALRGEFDVVVSLYHDQGLAPLKAVAFEESVNVTLGLPFLRTSPDHGTAFDIAGKGVANGRSLARAIELALVS